MFGERGYFVYVIISMCFHLGNEKRRAKILNIISLFLRYFLLKNISSIKKMGYKQIQVLLRRPKIQFLSGIQAKEIYHCSILDDTLILDSISSS